MTKDDLGCYADGTHGHDHIRRVLAALIEDVFEGKHGDVQNSLRGIMPDDAWDEDEAIDLLNGICEDGVYFILENGDLLLLAEEREET
jgi:hypothetical protein